MPHANGGNSRQTLQKMNPTNQGKPDDIRIREDTGPSRKNLE